MADNIGMSQNTLCLTVHNYGTNSAVNIYDTNHDLIHAGQLTVTNFPLAPGTSCQFITDGTNLYAFGGPEFAASSASKASSEMNIRENDDPCVKALAARVEQLQMASSRLEARLKRLEHLLERTSASPLIDPEKP